VNEIKHAKKALAVLLVGAALLLSGCTTANSAAKVGKTNISESVIENRVAAIIQERKGVDTSQMQLTTGKVLNRTVLRFHLISELFVQIAADQKIVVTKAEIDTQRAQILTQIGGEKNLPKALAGVEIAAADFDLYLQTVIISTKLQQAAAQSGADQDTAGQVIQQLLVAKAAEDKVVVNARYGKWDPTSGDIVDTEAAGAAVSPKATP